MGRPLSPCGTLAAYRRHLRNGEKACPDCLQAARAASAGARDQRRSELAAEFEKTTADEAAARITRFLGRRSARARRLNLSPRIIGYHGDELREHDLRILLADRVQLQRRLDAAEAATCKHDEAGE